MNTMTMKITAYSVDHLRMVLAPIVATRNINMGVAQTNASIAGRVLWARAQIALTGSTSDKKIRFFIIREIAN